MPDDRVQEPLEAPDEARMRTTHDDDGRLTHRVQYRRDGQTYVDRFPADRVRLDTVDRSKGRD